MKQGIWGSLILILYTFSCQAQVFWENHELFNTRNGLPGNAVLSIAQDNRNLLWIGTRNGLCIYDGTEFEIRKNIFGDSTEWDNVFSALFKDRAGNIWIAMQTGRIGLYPLAGDSLIQLRNTGLRPKVYVSCFYQDASGSIWMGTNDGALLEMPPGIVSTPRKRSSIQDYVSSIQQDGAGNFILNHYYKLPLATSKPLMAPGQQITHLIYSGRSLTIYQKDGQTSTVTESLLSHHHAINLSRSGKLLLATAQQIREYDADGKQVSDIMLGDGRNYDNEDIANFIFEDATGILWLGTNFGLIKINKDRYNFLKFSTNAAHRKLNSNYVRSVFTDDKGNIWVGYKGGPVNLLRYNNTSKKYTTLRCVYADRSVIGSAINTIRQLHPGSIVLGGAEGLFISSPAGRTQPPQFRSLVLKRNTSPFKLSEVWSLYEDKKGRIWAGTRAMGLYIIDPVTHHYTQYPFNDSTGLTSIWQITEDHKGDIWLATNNGLDSVVFDRDRKVLGFVNMNKLYGGSAGKQVWSVIEDNAHRLWIGTTDNGISMVDRQTRKFITFNQQNGLPGNVTCGMLKDSKGHIWVTTLNAISRINPANLSFQHVSETNGLPGGDFNFNASCQASNGMFYYGTKGGMFAFDPANIVFDETTGLPVVIRMFSVWNKNYMDNPASGQQVALGHSRNSFSLRFALPHFATPGKHRYQYSLEDFDNGWTMTDARHPIATYTNVPPGKYRFLVRASIDGRHWGKPARLYIDIAPAFWQRPLFQAMGVLVVMLAIACFIYSRFRRSVARERDKSTAAQKFAELELRALQAQMNPHFIFNSINAIQHFMLTNDEHTANAYLSKFARLMRLYLESSKNKYISLGEEIELLQLYVHLEKLRFEDKFDFKFSVDPYFEHTALELPSMLLQPYVENAINHGLALRDTKGELNISFANTRDGILCVIDDNGVGRHYAGQSNNGKNRSRGTDLISERLTAFRVTGDIDIKIDIIDKADATGKSSGTRVEIFIPQ